MACEPLKLETIWKDHVRERHQIAQGIDEATWMYHLRRGDYSRWFRHAIKDEQLADETTHIETRDDLAPWQTRQMIQDLIHARYTLPE